MDVNRQNYEQYILDYFEGRLTASEEARLLDFLEQEPDLKAEFDEFENIRLEYPQEPVLNNSEKKKLKEQVIRNNFNDYAIACLENDLDSESRALYRAMVNTDEYLQKEEQLFMLSKLQADSNLQFPGKEKLKRSSPLILLIKPVYMRYAASLLLLIGTYALYHQYTQAPGGALGTESRPIPIAKQNKPVLADKPVERIKEEKKATGPTKKTTLPQLHSSPVKKAGLQKMHKPVAAETIPGRTQVTPGETALHLSPLSASNMHSEPASIILPEVHTAYTPLVHTEAESNSDADFPELTETLRKLAVRRINALALQNSNREELKADAPRIHFFELAARLVKKITFNAVKLNGHYNEAGQLQSYQVQAGNYAMQKEINR